MKLAIDVFYKDDTAKIVAAAFDHWADRTPTDLFIKYKTPVDKYISGEFYKRELPCLSDLISDLDLNEIEVVIIDGYVYLDNDGKPGLGARLYEHLNGAVPVVGVAKTYFANNKKHVVEVKRGKSQQPLYVTAIGIELCSVAHDIKCMYGEYRMPYILKLIDTETKK